MIQIFTLVTGSIAKNNYRIYLRLMGWFNRTKTLPAFPALQAFAERDQYFVRIAQWRWLNKEMITVIDPHAPRILTLDPWPQLIFLAADGTRTVSDYIQHMAKQYSGQIPERLDATIIHEIKTLLNYRIIKLNAVPESPIPLFDAAS